MADREDNANENEQKRNRDAEHPSRPEPGTLEGPGPHQAKGEEDARNEITRRGER